jgi:hypothetical protein
MNVTTNLSPRFAVGITLIQTLIRESGFQLKAIQLDIKRTKPLL